MDTVNLPVENAREPDEDARQPVDIESTGIAQNTIEQVEKNVLSQPPKGISHKQKLLWLQKRRTEGLWAQCDDCDRWRYLSRVLDSYELPPKWFCWMNPDTSLASCLVPEVPICLHDEDDLIHAEYAAGSLVLARLPGFPWWPAMVDDCPDTEQYYWLDGFSDIPSQMMTLLSDSQNQQQMKIISDSQNPKGEETMSINIIEDQNVSNNKCTMGPEFNTISDLNEPSCFQTQETTSMYIAEDTQSSDDFDF